MLVYVFVFFFFQAEDGIRDYKVTGVQTCALPIYGLMGRTPAHVACVLSAFAGWRQLFDRGGTRFGDNVVRFYERARDEDLYVAYGIVPLQIDRSQPAHRQPAPFLYPGVAAERDGG